MHLPAVQGTIERIQPSYLRSIEFYDPANTQLKKPSSSAIERLHSWRKHQIRYFSRHILKSGNFRVNKFLYQEAYIFGKRNER